MHVWAQAGTQSAQVGKDKHLLHTLRQRGSSNNLEKDKEACQNRTGQFQQAEASDESVGDMGSKCIKRKGLNS